MPNANRLTVGIMAMVAEEEGRMISARTKAALAATRKRGTVFGRGNVKPKMCKHSPLLPASSARRRNRLN